MTAKSYIPLDWRHAEQISPETYTCGHCGKVVGPSLGYRTLSYPAYRIYICSFCWQPTYFENQKQTPGVAYGNEVAHLPPEVEALYNEARNCMSVAAYTSAVLACRKLLMNISVSQGASAGQSFMSYVEYLANNGFVPPNGRGWVDHIRRKGNEATHEINLMTRTDAEELLSFVEMLLKFIFEFPSRVPQLSP